MGMWDSSSGMLLWTSFSSVRLVDVLVDDVGTAASNNPGRPEIWCPEIP